MMQTTEVSVNSALQRARSTLAARPSSARRDAAPPPRSTRELAGRLVPTRANNQPALGYYLRDPHAPVARARRLLVLTLSGDKIRTITRFADTGLLSLCGLPATLRD
jgi:hypothetical protein